MRIFTEDSFDSISLSRAEIRDINGLVNSLEDALKNYNSNLTNDGITKYLNKSINTYIKKIVAALNYMPNTNKKDIDAFRKFYERYISGGEFMRQSEAALKREGDKAYTEEDVLNKAIELYNDSILPMLSNLLSRADTSSNNLKIEKVKSDIDDKSDASAPGTTNNSKKFAGVHVKDDMKQDKQEVKLTVGQKITITDYRLVSEIPNDPKVRGSIAAVISLRANNKYYVVATTNARQMYQAAPVEVMILAGPFDNKEDARAKMLTYRPRKTESLITSLHDYKNNAFSYNDLDDYIDHNFTNVSDRDRDKIRNYFIRHLESDLTHSIKDDLSKITYEGELK